MKKRIVTLALAISALSLAGCGSQAPEASADVENAESAASQDSTDDKSAESTTILADESTPLASSLDPNSEYVFGTATLSYTDFYSGDVSSTDSYDVVSSATSKKYELFTNMATDYVDETTNADGYHITGVKNVNVAVPADQADTYASLNDSFVKLDSEPAQYKIVSVNDGTASYSATVFNVADTVTDATAELLTGSNRGDYQINILENSTSYIRSSREDETSVINSDIQGVIVETKDGLKVGMEHLQSIWVMPYEISFNISADNSHNTRVSFDNLAELSKLEEKEIVSVTFIYS
ncbi:LptM family lipoprotein [Butyrivibrio sp. VCB2006]|uniref:LptM family lipoprotein n=1 Tax=Butyrivibrio sp. VCB2006 TaxID=1280679 RepID=UPI00041A3545|nr:hypothetical protein [Butyrivibrio sp. VCB2006]